MGGGKHKKQKSTTMQSHAANKSSNNKRPVVCKKTETTPHKEQEKIEKESVHYLESKNIASCSSSSVRGTKTTNSGRYTNFPQYKHDEKSSKYVEELHSSSSECDVWSDTHKSIKEPVTSPETTKRPSEPLYNLSGKGFEKGFKSLVDMDIKKGNSSQNKPNIWKRDPKEYKEFDLISKQVLLENMEFKVVQEVQGDLFLAGKEYSLGHCVAEDMNMGSGIAVTFRQIFKRVDQLLNQRQTQGGLAVLEIDDRFIYYLVTKRLSSGKPTPFSLWLSLQKMKDHIVHHHVKKLALPRIGCGLDGLEWSFVKRILEITFCEVNIEITIFNFQQDLDAPPTRLRKCPVVNERYALTEIEYGTVIIYFVSEDGKETEEIRALSEKFPYIRSAYRFDNKEIGTCIRTDRYRDGYTFYGCVVRKCSTDLFDFVSFQKCLNFMQTQNRKDNFKYFAFQAFVEEGDTFTVSKIVNLMRYSLTQVKLYVCWPKNLLSDIPKSYY